MSSKQVLVAQPIERILGRLLFTVPIYGYALLANKTPVTKAKIYAYNQYTQKTTMAMVWITPDGSV
jgi:hypothetical protein